jgi:hypothetical protein
MAKHKTYEVKVYALQWKRAPKSAVITLTGNCTERTALRLLQWIHDPKSDAIGDNGNRKWYLNRASKPHRAAVGGAMRLCNRI